MQAICGDQIQAARIYLKMTRKDLAKATGLSPNTIRNLEQGGVSPRGDTNRVILHVIENLGLEFTEGQGVRRRKDDIKLLDGKNSYDDLIENMQRTIDKKGSTIGIMVRSMALLAQSLDMTTDNTKPLQTLMRIAPVQCLFAEAPNPAAIPPSAFECRVTLKENISPQIIFMFGDKYAHPVVSFGRQPRYVIYNLPDSAKAEREHFTALWQHALSILPR